MDKLICVGKNYLKHAQELGDAVPEQPIIFVKPPSTLCKVEGRADVAWPAAFDMHHEIELVLRLARKGDEWTFSHYTFGLDMTLRDVQARQKKNGWPWERAKVFVNSAVVGPFYPITNSALELPFSLKVNGEVRQSGIGRDMRWKPEALLEDLATWLPLTEGDLLFTGTPEGVGPVADGDELEIVGGDVRYAVKARRSR